MTRWTNWSGTVTADVDVATPATVAELHEVVRAAAGAGKRVKPIGAGHSFTAIGQTDGVQIRPDKLAGIVRVDRAAGGAHRPPGRLPGAHAGGATPVPIPNTAVKPAGPMIVPQARKSVIAGILPTPTQPPPRAESLDPGRLCLRAHPCDSLPRRTNALA